MSSYDRSYSSFSLTFATWSSAQVLAIVLLLCFLLLCFLLNLTLFVVFLDCKLGVANFPATAPIFEFPF